MVQKSVVRAATMEKFLKRIEISPGPFQNNGNISGKKGDDLALRVIGSLLGTALILLISCYCARKVKRALIKDMHRKRNATAVIAPPASNMVQVWEVDAATMERFLLDVAREKPIRFTAQQLCDLTSNYSTRLGSGGFGVVYRGMLSNGVKIAVKVLSRSSDKKVVEEQFMAEVGTIGRTYHINLVRLYGFCFDHLMSALVYEYMENGSLDKFLFNKMPNITFKKLHEIAIGTAKGIAYLHEECQQRIIHYDIKPGNVLLDANFSPKVADFGLAKLCNRDNTHVSVTGYRGTPGYSAPEFLFRNYPITHKCDVYSFGMLLFEIVGRRRNANINPVDSLDWFPRHVWEEYTKGELAKMSLICEIEEIDREMAERMFMVAFWCVQDSPGARPLMSNVVKMLEGRIEIAAPTKPFQYLDSPGRDALTPLSGGGTGSSYSKTEGTDSSVYKDQTRIMRKYEIEMAISS